MCCVASLISTVFPVINAFYPSFEAVVMASIAGSVINGITGPCNGALRADCVPLDPSTGKSANPAR